MRPLRCACAAGALALFGMTAAMAHAGACSAGLSNPVVTENCSTDSSTWSNDWQVDRTKFVYDPSVLAGYVSRSSINRGGSLNFYIQSPQKTPGFTIDIYRLGYYGGMGGRLVQHIGGLTSAAQPPCRWEQGGTANGYFSCNNWHRSYALNVPSDWTSGVYVAAIRSLQKPGGDSSTATQAYAHDVVFVVRDDARHAAFLYQQAVATEQAYNSYVYGPGLYDVQTITGNVVPVAKATFERPFDALDNLQFYRFELPFIFWLERNGYDVAYTTDIDTHERATPIAQSYRAFILSGHSEYWSRPMYDAVQAARDAGVHLGFFGGDTLYWQMRLEDETAQPGDGTHNGHDRVMVVFRNRYPPLANGLGDPNPDPALQTIYWRDFPLMRDEQALVGVHFTHPVDCTEHVAAWAGGGTPAAAPSLRSMPQPLVVASTASWVFDGTGLHQGDSVPHVYGQESDAFERHVAPMCGRGPADPAARAPAYRKGTFAVFASSPFDNVVWGPGLPVTQPTLAPVNSVVFQACSGAWVFAAGDIMWGNALAPSFLLGQDYTSAPLQQLSANVLDVFAGRKSVPAGGACVLPYPAELLEPSLQLLLDH
jgi:hypothetical protein